MPEARDSEPGIDRLLARVGAAFLLLQVGMVVHGLATPGAHFAWAPHTTQVHLELSVVVDGRQLTEEEGRKRYGLLYYPWEAHSEFNVQQLIQQHERTYGADERAEVVLRYRRNSGEIRTWEWSEP